MADKKKPLFNIIDVLVVLVLIAAVAAGFWLLRDKNVSIGASGTASTAPVEFTLLALRVDTSTLPDIQRQLGGDVYSSTDNSYLGTLTAVEPEVYSNIEYSQVAGAYVTYEDEAYRTVYLTIRGDASISDKDIIVNGNSIKVGATMSVKGKGYAVSTYVVDINDNLEQ